MRSAPTHNAASIDLQMAAPHGQRFSQKMTTQVRSIWPGIRQTPASFTPQCGKPAVHPTACTRPQTAQAAACTNPRTPAQPGLKSPLTDSQAKPWAESELPSLQDKTENASTR